MKFEFYEFCTPPPWIKVLQSGFNSSKENVKLTCFNLMGIKNKKKAHIGFSCAKNFENKLITFKAAARKLFA